jgi:catechol 2,3-dioxygenase-like lactoylglutathione lyase family enzyme
MSRALVNRPDWRRRGLRALVCAGVLTVATGLGGCASEGNVEPAMPSDDGAGGSLTDPASVAAAALPEPTFHHLHINAVDPAASLAWWKTVWPEGEVTDVAGFPAFAADGVYHLYSEVATPAPGGFDVDRHHAVPQSAFWTTGPSTDGLAFFERLTGLDPTGERFRFLPVYTGPDDAEGVLHSGLAPYGDRLLTVAELEALAGAPPERGPNSQDFGYLVDPDGVLLEFNGNADTEDLFYGHLHFWHEAPLCAVNWYVEHLGARGTVRDLCDVERGPVSYPSFFPSGQLRQPIGTVRVANTGLMWYTSQCRDGRCGDGGDGPLVPSRGQVVDHMGLSYPDLDPVIAHLERAGIPILDGPYPFGDVRAILIEDLDGLALELIEAG